MLANLQLITKMSLEQKLKFVTSLTYYESSSAGTYEFPVFKLKGNLHEDCPSAVLTRFPSDRALASSWNTHLISDVYNAIGEEMKRLNPFGYFTNCDDYSKEGISNDNFATAKFILARSTGLVRSGKQINFEKTNIEEGEHTYDKKFVADSLLADVKPTSVLVKNPADIEPIVKKYKYGGLFFGSASSVEECVRLLLEGASLVFLSEDFTPALVNFLTERTEAYRKAYKEFRGGEMKLSEFDRRVRELEIFDEEIINTACDKLISLILEMKAGGENIPEMTGLNGDNSAKFDEISHDALALRASRESVILLKNDGILPLAHSTRVAVAGEYAKDFSYQRELFGGSPTVSMLPFEVINEYEGISATGYVPGYKKGECGRADLIGSAVELAGKSDCTVVYLCAGKGQNSLPPEQTELLDALFNKGTGVIAVVACDANIDLSFADKCRAVLLTYNGGQESTSAVLDILAGIVSPSGKLTEELINSNGEVLFPFGYGLSYTRFDYRNLRVNQNGVYFTVVNAGDTDGYSSVQLYIKKSDSNTFFINKTLRGFAKTFVKKGDAVNVEIPFDENTFKAFNDAQKYYEIEGGEYEISISDNYDSDRLSGTITLGGHIYKDVFGNETVEISQGENIEFTADKEKRQKKKTDVKLSFGVKLFVALMLGVYYNGLVCVFAFTPIIPDKTLLIYIILGAVAGIINTILLVYIIVISVNRKKQLTLSENDVLTDMIENIAEFKEIAKVTYATPVPEEEKDEEEDGALSARKRDENIERTFDADIDESGEQTVFTEHISLAEVCANFREYALNFGVNIEMTSVRAIISAVASSKIVVLKCANTAVLPDFLEALCSYFSSNAIKEADDGWEDVDDLLWKDEGDRYGLSEFGNCIYSATKSKAKMFAAILTNVNPDNVSAYFGNFIDYANHPSEEHSLKMSNELTINLPDNVTYFIVPKEGKANCFSKEVINASVFVDLAISKAENGGGAEAKNISLAEFCDLITASREEFFLPEKVWKKVDDLVRTIGAGEKFEIGNKNTLQTEKLTSVILDCGGDEGEALTQMFVCKLIPLIKTTRLYRQDDGDRTIFATIEKLFPEDELTKIQKALVKLN